MRFIYWTQRKRDALVRWLLEHTSTGRFVLYQEWVRGYDKGWDEGKSAKIRKDKSARTFRDR